MSNETCTVTIADIYGAEWWERNKEELDRDWEWEFGLVQPKEKYAIKHSRGITMSGHNEDGFPRIILHRRKPKPPTLREVYGVDEVKIPVGWEWTGEFKQPKKGDNSMDPNPPYYPVSTWDTTEPYPDHPPRLILRERPKKVWFKAEEKARCPKAGDYIWTSHRDWAQAEASLGFYLCATRHEEIDSAVQVVTQADIDALTQPSK